MAAVHLDIDLLGSAYEGDALRVATWIVKSDGKLRLGRHCQIIHSATGRTLARGDFDFVCTNLDNGRPDSHAAEFQQTYVIASEEISP